MFLIQCILIAMVHVLGILDGRIFGQNLLNTPIVEATLVGLICGDVHTGLVMGATLQLIFMGFVGIGVTTLPNSSAGTILAVAFACLSGLSSDAAIALAMPVALVFQICGILPRVINNVFSPLCDKAADRGDYKAIERYFWLGVLDFAVVYFVPMFIAVYFGSGAVEAVIKVIPQVILDGMNKASTMLPALGIALLMNYIVDKETMPYIILGFTLAAFLGMNTLGVSAIGLVIALVYYNANKNKAAASTGNVGGYDDDDDD